VCGLCGPALGFRVLYGGSMCVVELCVGAREGGGVRGLCGPALGFTVLYGRSMCVVELCVGARKGGGVRSYGWSKCMYGGLGGSARKFGVVLLCGGSMYVCGICAGARGFGLEGARRAWFGLSGV
jgi:hypothetical protein